MTVTVKHPFVSAVADSGDTSLVRPSNWNADHTVVGLGTAAELNAGVANGVATLDSGGQVPLSQIPPLGDLNYQGTWNASTNSPTLTSSTGTKGYYYVVSVAGSTNLNGITDWKVSDWAVYNGTAWQKIDNTDSVTSVNGYTGAVVLTYTDVGAFPATPTTGANSVVLRDANQNVSANAFFSNSTSVAAAGTTTTLVASSTTNWSVTGSGGQTFQLPDATTLPVGATFTFNNNQTSGTIVVKNNSGTTVVTVQSGGFVTIYLLVNTPAAGSWDTHYEAPSNVSWSTNTFDYAGSITSATWNGTTVQVNRGGTGATTLTGYVKGSGTTALTASTSIPTTDLSGTVTNAQLANSTITINGTSVSLGGSTSVGTVTSVTGTAPIVSSGGTTPAISMAAASASANGYLTSADWTTFNSKGSGSVTSVAATVPAFLSIAGTPITSSGTLAISYSGTALPVANGGTGLTSTPANGALDIGNGTGFTRATLTAGSGVTITNASGAITIAASSSGATITDDTSTNATRYVNFTAATSGALSTINTSSTKLTYNPSTGAFGAPIVSATTSITTPTINTNNTFGFKNRFINGAMKIDQRNAGAAQTITSGAALAYTIDRWFAYCTGTNITGQRVAGSGNNQYNYQFTGVALTTAIGFGQRIESANCYDLAGQTCTLSVNLANSLLTTVTWTASYANTADSFGTLASPTVTSIATGTFTVSSTLTNYSVNISVPSAATTGIQIVFSVGLQVSGTFTIGNAQLEVGAIATSFDVRPYGTELLLSQRYFYKTYSQNVVPATSTTTGIWSTTLTQSNQGTGYIETQGTPTSKVTMRTSPTITVYDNVGNIGKASYYNGSSLINNYPWTLNAAADTGFSWYSDNVTTKGGVVFHYTSSAEL